VGFVISLNLHRRHLNEAQPACVADTLADMPHGGDRRSEQGANWRFVSQEEAAALLNTSVRSIQNAARLEREAPELLPHVMAGRLVLCPRNNRSFLTSASRRGAAGLNLFKRVTAARVFCEN
jgi:hypothetical protein